MSRNTSAQGFFLNFILFYFILFYFIFLCSSEKGRKFSSLTFPDPSPTVIIPPSTVLIVR